MAVSEITTAQCVRLKPCVVGIGRTQARKKIILEHGQLSVTLTLISENKLQEMCTHIAKVLGLVVWPFNSAKTFVT
jgi:hypothetical protein